MTSPPQTVTTRTIKSPSKRTHQDMNSGDSPRNVRARLSIGTEGRFHSSDDPFTVPTDSSVVGLGNS